MTVVATNDNPNLVRNRCVIEFLWRLCVVSWLSFSDGSLYYVVPTTQPLTSAPTTTSVATTVAPTSTPTSPIVTAPAQTNPGLREEGCHVFRRREGRMPYKKILQSGIGSQIDCIKQCVNIQDCDMVVMQPNNQLCEFFQQDFSGGGQSIKYCDGTNIMCYSKALLD